MQPPAGFSHLMYLEGTNGLVSTKINMHPSGNGRRGAIASLIVCAKDPREVTGSLAVVGQLTGANKFWGSFQARGLAWTVTFSTKAFSFGRFFLSTSRASSLDRVTRLSSPMSLPKTVLRPSRCAALSKRTKNWDPFVAGPLLAMEMMPRALCFRVGRISSSKGPPQML